MISLIVMVNTDTVNINRVCLKVRYKVGIRGDYITTKKATAYGHEAQLMITKTSYVRDQLINTSMMLNT